MKASTMMKMFARKLAAVAAVATLTTTMGCLADDVDAETVDTSADTIRVDPVYVDHAADGIVDELDSRMAFDAHRSIDLAPAAFEADEGDDDRGSTDQLAYNPDPTPWLDSEANAADAEEGGDDNPDPTPWHGSSTEEEEPDPQPWNEMSAQ